jgi:hypothetical protein
VVGLRWFPGWRQTPVLEEDFYAEAVWTKIYYNNNNKQFFVVTRAALAEPLTTQYDLRLQIGNVEFLSK